MSPLKDVLMVQIAQTLFYQQGFSQFRVEEMLSVGLSETEIIELQNGAIVEQTHVDTIVQVLESLNVQPLNQPRFFFQFSSVVDFIVQLSVQEVYVALCVSSLICQDRHWSLPWSRTSRRQQRYPIISCVHSCR